MNKINASTLLLAVLAATLSACSSNQVAPETKAEIAPAAQPTTIAPVAEVKRTETPPPATDPRARDITPPPANDKPVGTLPSIGAPDQRSVYFDYDRYEVKGEFTKAVADQAKFINGRADAKMLIQGNADERGSREYNLALGQRRADAVKKSLQLQGVKEESLEAVSLGEEKPKAVGHDEASWAENRRADMLYKGEY